MSNKPNIGKIIKEQRKRLSLSLYQLSRLSGVSVAHLGRIEQGQRGASTRTLQKIAEPLGFDLYELLVVSGHLLPNTSTFSSEQREKLRNELNTLLQRVESDTNRISEIVKRLLLTK
ncbi:hypothetical protein ES707_06246 [subsurface metagenome]